MTDFEKNARAKLLEMPMNTPYTREEVATVLNVNLRTVQRLMSAGQLKFARVAGGVRILKEWVYEYLHREWDNDAKPAARNPMHS